MTDIGKLKTLYEGFGIEHKIETRKEELVLTIKTKTKNVTGYNGFLTEFHFDSDGAFKNVGIYE
ncbi:hypothetical protein NIE88_18955 [Sporolactobacillus shoreicorticis]|uniref:Uncharacterized protein n=1 Tax=Sporolactobacillus shoreicorticis TaxID=1923877 RepID=A0ABW5S8J9_9BACL|nr:hypothetical protein [Sporolactobacillus shoreicorticis]MCO7127830.1 hypothetical protein [Sporolactobacillus shoreicorticis]